MPNKLARRAIGIVAALCAGPALAQGTTSYLNFEAPAHRPIACTTAAGRGFLLVCNGPDNAVEVYSTRVADSPAFVTRVPVGLEPVTVVTKPSPLADDVRRCYVANWLGDSITIFDLTPTGVATVVTTRRVGDEPTGIAFHPADESLIVTFSAQSTWGWFNGNDLAPMLPGSDFLELVDVSGARAVKDPRAVAFSPTSAVAPNVAGQLCILNHRGGSDPAAFDYDLWSTGSVANSASSQRATLPDLGTLGSTNFNMAFAPNGDLYVVSQQARNKALANFVEDLGEPAMASLVTGSTGFVTSQLVRVRGIGSTTPVIDPALDLNSATIYQGSQSSLAVTQPTDLAIKGDGSVGTRVFVTGFNSDSLGMATTTAAGFTMTRIDLGHPTNKFSVTNTAGVMRGPRGLALNAAQSRLYVYNRIDHSVTVVNANFTNPAAAVIGNFPLQKDPTPAYIKGGRKFLYSSALSGGNNASCASCHIDATSDFLAWNLSDGMHVGPASNPLPGGDPLGTLGPNTDLDPASPPHIQNRKGPMQTQSLRGLVNFEVANDARQDQFFSNKPYHWRGDRATFQDFNGAFVNLLAINPHVSPTQGIVSTDMNAYREFINSVHYPPNPEQPLGRTYSGSMIEPNPNGSPAPLDDPAAGNGAAQGLKNFHAHNTDGRACMHCHSLPEGSNNRQTEMFGHVNSLLDLNRLETAALRALVSKEAQLWRLDAATGLLQPKLATLSAPITTGEFGLIHTGKTTLTNSVGVSTTNGFGSRSIVDFMFGFGLMNLAQINAMARFMREFDTGVAPTVGRTLAVTTTSPAGTVLTEMEQQATRANAGLAAIARLSGVMRGFWFDVTRASTTPYVEEPHAGVTPSAPLSRVQLLALLVNSTDLLVFQNTPLGASRRVAFLDGGLPPTLAGGAPTAVALRGCRPNNANANVPALTGEWLSLFQTTGYSSSLNTNIGNNKAMIYYQASLKHHAAAASPPGFGLADFRHEPPRRFVVTGTDIRAGAWLRIYLPNASDWATASPNSAPTTTPSLTSHPDPIDLPVFAAIDRVTGLLEWQSAAELEPYHLLALLNGGPANPAVQNAISSPSSLDAAFPNGGTSGANPFDPMLHNWYFVQVINDPANPATASAGVWQRMTLQ